MDSFLDEIIPLSALNGMRQLGDNVDIFMNTMKQIINFQNMLYNGLKTLSGKFSSIKTEVTFLNNQLLNVDDAVQAYLMRNPVTVYTRDGLHLDDALNGINDRLSTAMNRIRKSDENIENLTNIIEGAVLKEDISQFTQDLGTLQQTSHETTLAIEKIEKEVNEQKGSLDEKWNVMKEMFRQQVAEVSQITDRKVDVSELDRYMKHIQVAELMQLIQALPKSKRTRIPEIIPQIFGEKSMTMEEKIKKVYDMLSVERERVDQEKNEVEMEFDKLKQITLSNANMNGPKDGELVFIECEVRDIAVDSGYSEYSSKRIAQIKRVCEHRTIGSNFLGPNDCIFEQEDSMNDLVDKLDSKKPSSDMSKMSVDTIVSRAVLMVQDVIEDQMGSILNSLGSSLDKKDVSTLLKQLKTVDQMKVDMDTLKIKLSMKIDQAIAQQEFDNMVTKEEFYSYLESVGWKPKQIKPETTIPRVKTASRALATPRKKIEPKAAIPLVPSRSPKMLGVNDKYAIGDDGKSYLKELPSEDISNTSKISYHERSKLTMEVDGIDTVIDFQPFVPLSKNSSKKHEIGAVITD